MSLKPGLLHTILILIFFLSGQALSSQSYSARNNYTGAWEISTSWNPIWPGPQSDVIDHNITINGYITANSSLSFSGSSNLSVTDTLVIKGNLSLNDNNDLKIENNGILIVWGDLTISYDSHIEVNGYLIVTGNIIKVGDINHGEIKSNDDPVKIFVGGTIPSGLTDDNDKYKAINCTAPHTIPYPNSTCSYGNLKDIINDPVYPFFQSTCGIVTPTIIADGPTTFCEGDRVMLTSSAGTSYLWSTGATTSSINVTSSGSYSVRITNINGCQSSPSVPTIITVNSLPVAPVISAGGPVTFCEGSSVTLTSSPGNAYLWSTGAETASINVILSGSYSVRITDANGCQSAVSFATPVTVNSLPALPTITADSPTTFCNGGSVSLNSSPGMSYLWSDGATVQSIVVNTEGIYSVRVTDENGCQSIPSAPTTVTVNPLPVTPTITAGSLTTFCAGGNVTLTSSPGSSYLWSTGMTTSDITVAVSGSYSVMITNANGCQSTPSVATVVSVNDLPPMPAISTDGPTTFCAGGSVTLTSDEGTSYLWSTGATTPEITVAATGNYTVRVTNSNGCESPQSTVTSVNINPLPSVYAGSDATIPNGTSTTIDATVTGDSPFIYNWSPSGLLLNPLIEDPTTVIMSTTTVFSLIATSVATSCSNTSSVTITITGGPLSSTPSATPNNVCAGKNVQLYANAGGGSGTYEYTWTSTTDGFTSSIANPVVNPAVSTTYNLTVSDGFTIVSSMVSVIVNPVPVTPTITVRWSDSSLRR